MGKLTAEQQKSLDELLRLQEAPDEDPEEVVVEVEGKKFTLPYKKVKPWLKKQGIDLDDILEEAEGESDEEEEEDPLGDEEEEMEEEPPVRVRRPKARSDKIRPVKKAAPKVVDSEPEMRGKGYWRRPA